MCNTTLTGANHASNVQQYQHDPSTHALDNSSTENSWNIVNQNDVNNDMNIAGLHPGQHAHMHNHDVHDIVSIPTPATTNYDNQGLAFGGRGGGAKNVDGTTGTGAGGGG